MDSAVAVIRQLFPPEHFKQVLLVGGTVRDFLMGRQARDLDLIALLSHSKLLGLGFRLVEAKSAAAIYFRHVPQLGKIEVTRLAERTDLPADLARRDFTVNAMAMELDGCVLDPLGGRQDLEARLLRPCSRQAFLDDPLRIFRAFRFAAEGWQLSPEAAHLIREREWGEAWQTLPVERFSQELLKALAAPQPERFPELMQEFSTGGELLPELYRMAEVPAGPLEHHPEGDLLTHSLQVLQRLSLLDAAPLPRFCALFHDLGKLATEPELYPRHHGHEQAGFALAESFCNRLKLPASYRRALAWVCRLHGLTNKWDELRDSTRIRTAEQALKAGIQQILPLVSQADKAGSRPPQGWNRALRVAGMGCADLGLDQARLESLPAEQRADQLTQRRVQVYRTLPPESSQAHSGSTATG